MNEIIPLVSFPKSGNTWMRFILSNLFKKDTSFEVNFKTINDISSTSHLEDHTKMISLLKENSPLFIKEHYNYYDMPYKNFHKAIYVYRNGFDTLLSYWHFTNAQSPGKYPDVETFSKYYWNNFGHWGENIYSWLHNRETIKKHKIFPICYEELLSDTVKVMSECLNFLEYDFTIEAIKDAVALSSKERLKKMNGSSDFMKSKNSNFHFVRSGKQGEGINKLPEKCKKEFMSFKLNYEMMVHYNYVEENNIWKDIPKREKLPMSYFVMNKYYNYKYKLKL